MSNFEPIYHLRVPESEKFKDEGKWFRRYIDYIIPYDTTVVSNYKQMKLWYDVINDRTEGFADELKKFCRQGVIPELSKELDFDEEIVHYNRIFSKYSYLNGQMLKRKDEHYAKFLSDEALQAEDEELRQEIEKAVSEQILLQFEKMDMVLAGASQIDADDYLSKMQSMPPPDEIPANFKSGLSIFANQVLQYCNYSEEVLRKKSLLFKHMITCDRPVVYVGEKHGKPGLHIINPLHFGFHKSPDEYRIEKGDYAWSRTSLTMAEVINLYGDILDQEQIEQISTYTYSSSLAVNERHRVIGQGVTTPKVTYDPTSLDMGLHLQDTQHKTVGQAQGSGTNRRYNNERLIFKTHFEFKAFRELTFVTSLDDFGKEVTEVHPGNFTIPGDATKTRFTNRYGKRSTKYEWVDAYGMPFSAERIWIPRRYEVTRLAQNIYIHYREVPNQPLNLDDPYGSFELSYKGRIMTSVNSESISLVGRALPSQFQYDLIKHIQNKELMKYEGYIKNIDVDQIPDYLSKDENGEPIGMDKLAIWRYFRRVFGDSYYSGSQNSGGLPNPTRSAAVRSEVAGAVAELFNLQRLAELVDREIGMSMAIPLQAEGQVAPNSNASDNMRSLEQGYTMIEWYMVEFSEVVRCALQEYLQQFTTYYRKFFRDNPNIKEHTLHYVVPGQSRQVVKILPEYLEYGNLGLFLTSDNADDEYRRMIMAYALQPMAQNAGEGAEMISTMIKAITSGASQEEIHKMIVLSAKDQERRAKELEKIRGENAARLNAEKRQVREDEQSHEIDKILLQGSLSKDADDIPASLEATKVLADIRQKDRDLDIKQQAVSKP